jgi:tRNA nucleotidyltransferase (CCA-adding enzyme)
MKLMETDELIAKVKDASAPSAEKRKAIARTVEKVVHLLGRASKEASISPKIEIGGSYAHDTWLETATDVDFFLVYPRDLDRAQFEKRGLSLAETALRGFSPRRRYAEHPYVEAEVDSLTVNVVPCYGVAKGEWKSAADRSPYHTKYMADHLDEDLKSEIRVLKKFLKAQALYGAEIRVRGFSGYACEVLVLKYGSFVALLRSASSWGKGVVISLEGGEENAKTLFEGGAFILLDPVDTTRNLGLAVSPSKLAEFIHLSRLFLKRPSLEFFRTKQLRPVASATGRMKSHTVLLRFALKGKSEDILWGELWKSANGIAEHLARDGVRVLRYAVAAERGLASIGFLLSVEVLPRILDRVGPEVFMKDASEKFLAASAGRGDSWWMGDDLRSHTLFESGISEPSELLAKYMEDPVTSVGFAKGLAVEAKETFEVLSGVKAYSSRRTVDRMALSELVGFRF